MIRRFKIALLFVVTLLVFAACDWPSYECPNRIYIGDSWALFRRGHGDKLAQGGISVKRMNRLIIQEWPKGLGYDEAEVYLGFADLIGKRGTVEDLHKELRETNRICIKYLGVKPVIYDPIKVFDAIIESGLDLLNDRNHLTATGWEWFDAHKDEFILDLEHICAESCGSQIGS